MTIYIISKGIFWYFLFDTNYITLNLYFVWHVRFKMHRSRLCALRIVIIHRSKHSGLEKQVYGVVLIDHQIEAGNTRHPGHETSRHTGTPSVDVHNGEIAHGLAWKCSKIPWRMSIYPFWAYNIEECRWSEWTCRTKSRMYHSLDLLWQGS